MAMTMTEFLMFADRDLSKVWMEEEMPFEEQYSKYMNVVSESKLYKRDAKMAGFGPLVEISEGGDVTYDEAISPVDRRYDLVKRGLGYKITDKLWKFDEYGKVRSLESALRRADMDDTEVYFHAIFNNATNTNISAGFDSLALASTAHTRLDGGAVWANRPTTLTALSLTALQDAVIAFRNFVDDRGRPYKSMPRTLQIPLDLIITAEEILGSAMRPDTSNNATNALRRFGLSISETPYITSSTYWALIGDKHDINALWNQRSAQDSETDFDSDTIKRKTTKWVSRGHGEARGFYLGNT